MPQIIKLTLFFNLFVAVFCCKSSLAQNFNLFEVHQMVCSSDKEITALLSSGTLEIYNVSEFYYTRGVIQYFLRHPENTLNSNETSITELCELARLFAEEQLFCKDSKGVEINLQNVVKFCGL